MQNGVKLRNKLTPHLQKRLFRARDVDRILKIALKFEEFGVSACPLDRVVTLIKAFFTDRTVVNQSWPL